MLAQESYNRIIREQGQATNLTPAFKDALDSARNEVGAVSARIANVVITIEGPAQAQVTIDGQPISSAGLGLKRPVDPGQHVVKAEAPGYKPADTSFRVAAAGKAEASLTLEKAPVAPTSTGANPASSGLSTRKKVAVGALAVGGAGLVLGAITGLVAVSKHGKLSDRCPNGVCPAALQSDYDSYKTMGTLSTVGFLVGGVGAGAGALLWLTAPKEQAQARLAWHPYVGLGGGGVHGSF